MTTLQTYILPGITLASGCVIAYAILAYIAYLRIKMDSPSEVDGSGRRPCKRQLFEGSESWVIIVVFAIASILIFISWYFYYTGHIGSFSSDTLGTMTQTAIIGEWFKQLLCCQIGCATFFISLALIMVRLSTSVYSIRAFKSAFNPLDTDKGIILSGACIYALAAFMCLVLATTLSLQVLGLPDLKTPWGFWAVFLLLVLCVIAFEILGLFFIRSLRITQSNYIIDKELNRIILVYNSMIGDPHVSREWVSNEVEKSLQLISNVINSSIQQYDSHSSEYGINQLSKKVSGWIKQQAITKSYVKKMTNSTRVALLSGDEITAIGIIEATKKTVLTDYIERLGPPVSRAVGIYNMRSNDAGNLRNLFRRAFLWDSRMAAAGCMTVIGSADLQKFERISDFYNDMDCIASLDVISTNEELEQRFLCHMELLIKSYSDLGQFAVERNYTRSALECIEVLKACNEELFKLYVTEGFKPGDPPKDATKRDVTGQRRSHGANSSTDMSDEKVENHSYTEEGENLYDLSASCVRSASLISQIADKQNYETLVVRGAEATSQMHSRLCKFLGKEHPRLPSPTASSTKRPEVPKNLLSHYIWSIEDAGVSAANSNLEWGSVKYIECMEGFGKNILSLADEYRKDKDIEAIAISVTHTSTAIRNTGQQLAKGKFQEGSIRAMFAIKELAIAMLGRSGMVWVDENSNEDDSKRLCEDTTKKLAFVRAVWNIKDIGRSAAENGIEKAVVTAADILYDLLAKALERDKVWYKSETGQQDGLKETQDNEKIQEYQHHKKTEGLLSISEGFYEIAMIAKEKRLKDALTKIIYYNVISVRCLAGDKGGDYNKYPALNTYLRTFVDLQMVDEFTTGSVQGFLKELSLDQDLKSHKEYKDYSGEFSERICKYCSKESRTPDTEYQCSVRSAPDVSRASDTKYRVR